VQIDPARYSLATVNAAHQALIERKAHGKLVVDVI